MSFWQYILSSTGNMLGPIAIQGIFLSTVGIIIGVALLTLPKEFAKKQTPALLQRLFGLQEMGHEERKLRAELRNKIGVGLIIWDGALIISLLLRLFGSPGLDTRLLSTLVIIVLPFLVGSVVIYRLLFFPRYLAECLRLDNRSLYEPKKKKNVKKTTRQIAGTTHINYAPASALVGMFVLPVIYYIVLYTLSIPLGVPPQNHDHLLHQFGMPIVGMIGYLVGLMISLGEDMRALLPWLKSARK
jgi:uncharacterized membrane protein SpoIIM required for sporulation